MNIFLDFDGTLVDVFPRYANVLKTFMKKNGLKHDFTLEDYKKYKTELIKDHLIAERLTGELININDYYNFKKEFLEDKSYLSLDIPLGDFVNFANFAIKKGYKINLVTIRRVEENLIWQINKLGYFKYFNDIKVLFPEKLNKYEYLMQEIKEDDIIIGDGYQEIKAASDKNCKAFYVKSGLGISLNDLKTLKCEKINLYTEVSDKL